IRCPRNRRHGLTQPGELGTSTLTEKLGFLTYGEISTVPRDGAAPLAIQYAYGAGVVGKRIDSRVWVAIGECTLARTQDDVLQSPAVSPVTGSDQTLPPAAKNTESLRAKIGP